MKKILKYLVVALVALVMSLSPSCAMALSYERIDDDDDDYEYDLDLDFDDDEVDLDDLTEKFIRSFDLDTDTTSAIKLSPSSSWKATPTKDGVYFRDFKTDYYLSRDTNGKSRMKVVETITTEFPETNKSHGIVRVIPFTNNDGKNMTMASDTSLSIGVTKDGSKEKINEIEHGDGYFTVYVGDADRYVHGKHTYELTYEFENLILTQSDASVRKKSTDPEVWQELYWDVNGNDWNNSFDTVTVTIHMTKEVAKSFTGKTACYVGKYGENGSERCNYQKLSDTKVSFSTKEVKSLETLTFVMQFDEGTFAEPEHKVEYKGLICFIISMGGAALAVILAVAARSKVKDKRNHYKGMFVKPEYTPMKNVSVAQMKSNYLESGANGNDKVATMMELAVTGKIVLHKMEAQGILGKKTLWVVEVVNDDILPEQRDVLEILNQGKGFKKGDKIELKKNASYSSSAAISARMFIKHVKEGLQNNGLFEKGKTTSVGNASIIIFFIWEFATAIMMGFCFEGATATYKEVVGGVLFPMIMAVMMFVLPFIIHAINGRTSKYAERTTEGLDASKYLEGLKLYIKMAEKDRIEFLQSVKGADTSNKGVVKLYEKLLPYAVIFRMEKSWLKEMGKYYEMKGVSEPSWYVGMGAFSAHEFSSAMNTVHSIASSSITHSTTSNSSSGGSGFSGGGGHSGGGGGGGGGGSW